MNRCAFTWADAVGNHQCERDQGHSGNHHATTKDESGSPTMHGYAGKPCGVAKSVDMAGFSLSMTCELVDGHDGKHTCLTVLKASW